MPRLARCCQLLNTKPHPQLGYSTAITPVMTEGVQKENYHHASINNERAGCTCGACAVVAVIAAADALPIIDTAHRQ